MCTIMNNLIRQIHRYCDSRRKVLLAHVHEGYDKDWSVSLLISNTSFNLAIPFISLINEAVAEFHFYRWLYTETNC